MSTSDRIKKTPSILVMICGILISIMLSYFTHRYHQLQVKSHFDDLAKEASKSIQNQIDKNINALAVLKSFYLASNFVSFDEFKSFTDGLLKSNLSIQALEWIPKVDKNQRALYESKAKAFFNNFEITEKSGEGLITKSSEKQLYYPVYYVNPIKGNEKAIGFDLYSSKIRRQSIEKAIQTKKTTATKKITLLQEKGQSFGFLLFNPVYKNQTFIGFVLGVYRVNDIIKQAESAISSRDLSLTIQETSNNKADSILLNSNKENRASSNIHYKSNVILSDKKWQITAYPSHYFINQHHSNLPSIILILGLIITLIISAYLWVLINREIRINNKVDERTEQLHEANQRLQTLNNKLDQKVMDRTKKLQENQEQLVQSEKLASLGQLAAGVAHEINNPIGYIMSNIEVMGEYITSIKKIIAQSHNCLTAESADKQNQAIQNLQQTIEQEDIDYILEDMGKIIQQSLEGIEQVSNIVASLKSFSHSDSSQKESFNLNHIVEQALTVTWNELKYKCEVIKELSPSLPEILGFPSQINQVVVNILVNASHAIKDKGTITIISSSDDQFVELQISDTGSGISEEHMARLFDPFFTTKAMGEGTGLGLSISYGIVKKHGGSISVKSKVNHGTTFIIKLPKN